MKRCRLGSCAALLLLALAAPASAEEPDAEQLFREGRELMLADRFEEACPKLEQSQRLEPRGGTLLNLAVCHEKLGLIATAWAELRRAKQLAQDEGNAERERFATERIALLSPRVPWLTVSMPPGARPEGLTIELDGTPIAEDDWGRELPVDPGEHLLEAKAPKHYPYRQHLKVRESEHKTVALSAPIAEVVQPSSEPPSEPKPLGGPPAPVKPPPPKATPPAAGRRMWVLEVELFGGWLLTDTDRASLVEDPSSVAVFNSNNDTDMTCASANCTAHLPTTGGAAFGVSAFGGVAPTDWLHLGGRMLAGPRIGGGSLFATGPAAALRVAGPLWVGLGAMLGTASASGSANLSVAAPYSLRDGGPWELDASTDLAIGPSLEVALFVHGSEQGSLVVKASPMYLAGGNGTALLVPFGLAYRFY